MTNTTLPRYVSRYLQADGKYMYRYSPTQELVDAGVVPRQQLGTHKTAAIAKARRLNEKVDAYRAGTVEGKVPRTNSKMQLLVAHYYDSLAYNKLKLHTQQTYKAHIEAALSTLVEGKRFGDLRIGDITVRQCNLAYEEWKKRSPTVANERRRIFGVVFIHAIRLDLIPRNPLRYVVPVTTERRKEMWQPDQVKAFLDTAYASFETRNIGVLVHMSYEWCQRIGDMRMLKWEDIDMENKCVTIRQSKRGAVVYLPITDSLYGVLVQQQRDYGFQEYVAPYKRPADGCWRPFTSSLVSTQLNKVKATAGLPNELQARDLRRTGITELIIAGVDAIGVMQVSGHKSVESIKPYMVNTLQGASNALARRFAVKEEVLE